MSSSVGVEGLLLAFISASPLAETSPVGRIRGLSVLLPSVRPYQHFSVAKVLEDTRLPYGRGVRIFWMHKDLLHRTARDSW